jgi:hypothetical protein
VALVGPLQHRQEGARAVVDAAPADVEGPFPFFAAVRDHAAAAADPGVVEEQMDLVGAVALCDFVPKPLHLRRVGHVGYMRGDAQSLRQSRRLAQPLRFGHSRRRDVAHRDVAGSSLLQGGVPDLVAADAVLIDGSSTSLTKQAEAAGAKILMMTRIARPSSMR